MFSLISSSPIEPIISSYLYFAALLLSAIISLRIYDKIKPFHVPSTVPGPKRYPFIGILRFISDHYEIWPSTCSRMCNEHKRTWGGPVPNFGAMPGAFFFTNDEENVKYILHENFQNYEKGHTWRNPFHELLGEGIFSADGSIWVLHRKITSNMFSRNLLRHTSTITNSKIDEAEEFFDDKLELRETANVDIQDLFFRMTFDTTSLVAFGVEFDSIRKEKQHQFAMAFDEMQELVLKRYTDPFFEISRKFQLTKRERRIRQLKAILDEFAADIINSKRRTIEEGSSLGPDLISRFLEHSKKYDEPVSNEELRDVIMNMMLAGRDTTACALSWTFYELTRHPLVADKIIEEVKTICGTGKHADYSYDTVSKLKYTHAVAMEVLRLHPSVPNDMKFAVKDDILPDGTRIPAGSGVGYLPYSMGRSEEIWGEDVLEFKPERFLVSKEPSAFKFSAFNAGPRLCLGKSLALMTMKMVMARILPKYKFVDKLKHPGDYRWTTVRSMKGGFVVEVTKRV